METSSIFIPYQDYPDVRGDKKIMIKNSIGRQLPYIVNFQKSTCQIFDIELERVTHAFVFPDSCQLIDADYFPTADDKFGIIIGVEDKEKTWGSTNFILGLATNTDSPTMRVTHSLDLPERITVVKTVYSNDNMKDSKSLGLFPKLQNWKHIVAIGCKTCKCFLTQLTPVNVVSGVPVIHPAKKNVLDLLASFVEDDNFMYSLEDGDYRKYAVSSVYVSSLALMPRSRSLLVGLSMGGIIAASLNSSKQMQMLELRHDRVVHALAPLEPKDDPDKSEYFLAAINRSPRHPIMLQLWRGAFSKEQCPDEEKYDRPSFSACLEHKIMFGDRWLSVKTIVQERSLDAGLRRRNDSSMDSTLLNSSQLFGCTFNRSNVFLAYANMTRVYPFEVEAAIFDIDAWYYKRVPGKVQFDSTALRQCPFMSCIKSQVDSDQVTDIGILTLDSTNMYRFNSMISNADQLLYPSAVSYERVFVAFQTNISWMKIQNVQETILQHCASKLPWIVRSPDPMATNIIAAGLVRQNVLTGSPNTSATEDIPDVEKEREKPKLVSNLAPNLRVVLHSMIYYGRIEEFCALITRNDLSDKIKVEIADWAILEAIEYKKTIADRIVALFQGSTAALSPLAEDTLQQEIKMFRIVHEYLRGCILKGLEGLKTYCVLAKCMMNHTKLVHHFVISRIVPVNHSIEMLMRQQHEKRKNTASKNRTALPIQMTTRNMQRLAPIAQFWNHLPHDEWYPPTPLDLLESILDVSITERLKRDLIVQFVLDWIRANPENSEYTDSQLAMEVIKTMSAQMLDVDLEKIYYILEQEKAALTKPAAAAPVEEASASKKVFSLDKDGLTYEQLWSDKVHLGWMIKPADLERFKQRMEKEDAEYKKKLLEPESEMLYQAFLCQNQKYHLMSRDAMDFNKRLLSFYPNLLREGERQNDPGATDYGGYDDDCGGGAGGGDDEQFVRRKRAREAKRSNARVQPKENLSTEAIPGRTHSEKKSQAQKKTGKNRLRHKTNMSFARRKTESPSTSQKGSVSPISSGGEEPAVKQRKKAEDSEESRMIDNSVKKPAAKTKTPVVSNTKSEDSPGPSESQVTLDSQDSGDFSANPIAIGTSKRLIRGQDIIERRDKVFLELFQHKKYRSLQMQAIDCILERKCDVYVSLPTGAGKSLCYQLPAIVHGGVTVVVSPLIALMKDQIASLRKKGIPCETLHSTLTTQERSRICAELGKEKPIIRMLYITAEECATEGIKKLLGGLTKREVLSYIVVEEAQKMLKWQPDYRPDYLSLGSLREVCPGVPWVALTATANAKAQDDIASQLEMKDLESFKADIDGMAGSAEAESSTGGGVSSQTDGGGGCRKE